MKKSLAIILCLLFATYLTQAQEGGKQPPKTNQYDVLNDFSVSYGFGSLYYLIENAQHSGYSINSPGSFILGYTRSLNKVIGVGFQVAYTQMTTSYHPTTNASEKETFNYLQALARIKFQYLNKPSFAMYSGIAIGITIDYHTDDYNYPNQVTHKQKPLPAGQLTLLGFRIGRGPAFMGEFGIGTLSIFNLGFSYKFGN